MSLRQLVQLSARMRAEGKRLVLTNGCFDILHAGHVRYLHSARTLGDALVVALNGDRSVSRLKGRGRPLNSWADRAEVLAALADVDYVTALNDNDACLVVREVQPAVYVKGGDYDSSPDSARFPPEGRVVAEYGGEVRILPYLPGRSTTQMVDMLRNGKH